MPKAILENGEHGYLDNNRKYLLNQAKARLSELVDDVRTTGSAVVIMRRKKTAAVLIGVEEYEELMELKDTIRTERLRRAQKGKSFDLEKVISELQLGSL